MTQHQRKINYPAQKNAKQPFQQLVIYLRQFNHRPHRISICKITFPIHQPRRRLMKTKSQKIHQQFRTRVLTISCQLSTRSKKINHFKLRRILRWSLLNRTNATTERLSSTILCRRVRQATNQLLHWQISMLIKWRIRAVTTMRMIGVVIRRHGQENRRHRVNPNHRHR